MENNLYFSEEKVYTDKFGYRSERDSDQEEYIITFKPDGSVTVIREYHYYYERRDDNYDDQEDTKSIYTGTYQLKAEDDDKKIIATICLTRETTNTTEFMGNNEVICQDKEVDIKFDLIERKWNNKIGFTYKNNIFKNFDDLPDEVYFKDQISVLQELELSLPDIISQMKKYKGDWEKFLIEKYPEYKLEENKTYLKKQTGYDQTKWNKLYLHLVMAKGDPVIATELFDTTFSQFRSMLVSDGILDTEIAFSIYFSLKQYYYGHAIQYYNHYKARDVFKSQLEELKNDYRLVLEETYFNCLVLNEGNIDYVVEKFKPRDLHKKIVAKLYDQGFKDKKLNDEIRVREFNASLNYEQIYEIFVRYYDEKKKNDGKCYLY